ncbi:hypothetical protein [Oceanospirillum sediminis]|uniref:Uncharacterized protein n=1 Tax=Oceanospirillum sediminis TaxID=2760088 RepID=A0A839IKD2_9GAMM|nr:hypothetical protein [Oceanospirillum sediminis]MBB1485180.1 hypothetical protein [Oceanospirillum sediminis]
MKEKVWRIVVDNHLIKVINQVSFFPPDNRVLLEVDGRVIEHKKGSWLQLFDCIKTSYDFSGQTKSVEIRLAARRSGIGTGCQILVDGVQVSGDDGIQFPDPDKAVDQFNRGAIHYFITTGLVYGLPFAALMALNNLSLPLSKIAIIFTIHTLMFGGAVAFLSWNGIKSIVSER